MTIDANLRRRYARARAQAMAGSRAGGGTHELRAEIEASRRRTQEVLDQVRAGRRERGDDMGDYGRERRRPAFARSGRGLRSERREAFRAFLYGRPRADMVEADNVAGGFLAPPDFVAEMLRNLVLFSPLREIARVAQTESGRVEIPKRDGNMTATWRQLEQADAGETQPTYGQVALEVGELAAYVDVSNRLLEDAAFDLEAELALDFAEEFGRAEGAAFVNGEAGGQPKGLTKSGEIDKVNTGAAGGWPSSDPADVLIDLYHSLPSAYAANATWGMNRTTMADIRKFKLTDGQYLLQPGLAGEYPPTILGRPVVELPDMDDVAANKIPVVFGDFQAGFRIYDRTQLQVMRDPYSVQTQGLVRFHGRRRVAGGVVRGEAFKLLRVAA